MSNNLSTDSYSVGNQVGNLGSRVYREGVDAGNSVLSASSMLSNYSGMGMGMGMTGGSGVDGCVSVMEGDRGSDVDWDLSGVMSANWGQGQGQGQSQGVIQGQGQSQGLGQVLGLGQEEDRRSLPLSPSITDTHPSTPDPPVIPIPIPIPL